MLIITLVLVAIVAAIVLFARSAARTEPVQTPAPVGTESTSKPMEETTPTQAAPKETTTASGLTITYVKDGTGEPAKKGDVVYMKYTGKLTNGTAFDSNEDPKFGHTDPFAFVLGQGMVIAGWEEGVLGMKQGEKRVLTIPAALGYGERGAGGVIPPNATLIFDVEVVSITHN